MVGTEQLSAPSSMAPTALLYGRLIARRYPRPIRSVVFIESVLIKGLQAVVGATSFLLLLLVVEASMSYRCPQRRDDVLSIS